MPMTISHLRQRVEVTANVLSHIKPTAVDTRIAHPQHFVDDDQLVVFTIEDVLLPLS